MKMIFVMSPSSSCNLLISGFWFAHCHVEFHNILGMSMIFKEGNITEMVPPPPGFPRCGDYTGSSANNDAANNGPGM